MARSLKSKRRKQNNRALKERYQPKYDAQLKSIVANFQQNTEELMETGGEVDMDTQVQIVKPGENRVQTANELTNKSNTEIEKSKIRLPKVDIQKIVKFMSQRKFRQFKSRERKAKRRSVRKQQGQRRPGPKKPGQKEADQNKKEKIKW